ncbi:ATP-binding protein, partial [Nonomuraea sp. NPDC049784]|uniref:sensor histidine kinase n=1 Tax=Nonomuraea sp. NPDC049784 TaxID=3154361 RepID=UPI0033FACC55
SAREVLEATGATVRIDADPALLTDGTDDALLAVVVREAVTNVLRHSEARHVTIALSASGDHVRLRVANDGVTGRPSDPGQGVANLTERLAARGGGLTTTSRDHHHRLEATLPMSDRGRSA